MQQLRLKQILWVMSMGVAELVMGSSAVCSPPFELQADFIAHLSCCSVLPQYETSSQSWKASGEQSQSSEGLSTSWFGSV